jgi:hypothetical protein
MGWSWLRVASAVLIGCALVACSAPEARRSAVCQEGEDNCAPARQKKRADPPRTELGTPEPARAEDQEQPPPRTSTPVKIEGDAGETRPANGDAGTTIPSTPVLDASNACWSGTLAAWVELNGCYERRSDGIWFQCGLDTASQSNLWFRNVVDGVGRFGTCSSLHPLP